MTPSPISIFSDSDVEDQDVENSSADEDYKPSGYHLSQKPVTHVKNLSKKSHGLRPWKVGGNFNSAKFPKFNPDGKLSVSWRYVETLNIAQSYGASCSSGNSWSSAAGIWELVQNMFDAIMQGKDLQPQEIQAKELHNNKLVGTQATISSDPPTKSLHIFLYNKKGNAIASTSAEASLPVGYIAWRPLEDKPGYGDVELFNIGHMDRSAWLLGSSTKQDDPHLIGQYGDGLKIGINALLREDAGVQYHIGKEAWIFGYLDNELVFHIKKSTRHVDGVLIQVCNIPWQSLNLDHFLFLRPPVQVFAQNNTWSNGCVLLEEKHKSKIYVKGIFVRKEDDKTTGLVHGINIADDVVMSRDRSALNDREDAAEAIYNIWEPLILASSADARKRYIDLLLHQERSLDVEGIEDSISRRCATVLFKELREQHVPTAFFFYARETTEQRRIIEDHLLKTPVLLTKVFYDALRRHRTIHTPEEARELAFRALGPFIPDGRVVHPLRALLQLDPQLQRFSKGISFKSGHFDASIEISVKNDQVHLSENLLKPDYVHKKPGYITCLVAQAGSEDGCDCCTLHIADYITNELKITQNSKDQLRAQHRNLLEQMPRNLEVESKDNHAGDGPPQDCRIVVWSTRQRIPTAMGFVVALAKHEHDATAPTVLIHRSAQGAIEAAEAQYNVLQDGQLSIRTKEPFLPLRDLQLSPGSRYTLQVRTLSKLAIWSIPQSFTASPAAPSNIRVEKPALGVVHLRWDKAAGAESYNLHLIDEAGLTIERHDGLKECQWQGVLGDKILWTVRLDSFTRDGVRCPGTTDVPVEHPEPIRDASPVIEPAIENDGPAAIPNPQGPFQNQNPSPSSQQAPQAPVAEVTPPLPATDTTSTTLRASPKRQKAALLPKPKKAAGSAKSKPTAGRSTKSKPAEQLPEPQPAGPPAKGHAPAEEESRADPLATNWPDVQSDDDFDDSYDQAAPEPPNGDIDVDEATAQSGMARLHDELSALFGPYVEVNEELMKAGYNDVDDSGECVLDGVRVVVGHAYRVTLDNMQSVLKIHQILTSQAGELTYIHAARYIWASERFAQAREPNDNDELIALIEPPSGRVAVRGVDCARIFCSAIHPDGPDAEVQIRLGALPTDDLDSAPGESRAYACRFAMMGDSARKTVKFVNFSGHPEFDPRSAAPEVLDAPKPELEPYGTFVDFYAGCGAVARGFEAAGFSVLAGVESHPDAATSWQLNFPEAPLHAEDVRVLLDDLAGGKIASPGRVAVLSVSAPYVSSTDDVQVQKLKSMEHFKVIGQAIDVMQPAYILMDFAPALLSNHYRKDFQSMELAILSRQYSFTYKYLKPTEYGIATDCGRFMLLAARSGLRLPAWPAQTHGDLALEYAGPGLQPFVTVRDAIQDLEWRNPRVSGAGHSVFCTVPAPAPGLELPPPSEYAVELGAEDGPNMAHHTTGWSTAFIEEGPVLDYDKPCRALLAGPTGCWPSRHPKYPDELLTPRELARIASFPDLHRFAGSHAEQYRQIASAVPPLLVRAVALCVRDVLLEQYPHMALGVPEAEKMEVKEEGIKAEEREPGLGKGTSGEKRVYPEDEGGHAETVSDAAEGRPSKRVRLELV